MAPGVKPSQSDYVYNQEFGSVCLMNLVLKNLPEKIEIEGGSLSVKPEFHITLVTAKRLAPLIDESGKDKIEAEIVEEFKSFTRQTSLAEYELLGELRLVKRGERKTVIAMAKVPNLDKFFDILRRKYGVDLPTQPTHVTLYTLPRDPGIGILSDEELRNDSGPVQVPELQNLL